jgi:hypothetical protein
MRSPVHHHYDVGGKPMQRVTEVWDLGVRQAGDLSFRDHIISKAFRNLGFLLRHAKGFTYISAIKAVNEALIKSHLERNAAIWSPRHVKPNTSSCWTVSKTSMLSISRYLKSYGKVWHGMCILDILCCTLLSSC